MFSVDWGWGTAEESHPWACRAPHLRLARSPAAPGTAQWFVVWLSLEAKLPGTFIPSWVEGGLPPQRLSRTLYSPEGISCVQTASAFILGAGAQATGCPGARVPELQTCPVLSVSMQLGPGRLGAQIGPGQLWPERGQP